MLLKLQTNSQKKYVQEHLFIIHCSTPQPVHMLLLSPEPPLLCHLQHQICRFKDC